MITVKELSKKRNITPQAVQKKAKQLGIPKRNGRYLFTNDQLEQMYGERFPGLNSPINQPESNYYQPESNYYQKPINQNQHFSEEEAKFAKMTQSCQDKFSEIYNLMTEQRFQNEDIEEARQILLRSMGDIMMSFDSMNKSNATNNESKEMTVNLDVDNLIVE